MCMRRATIFMNFAGCTFGATPGGIPSWITVSQNKFCLSKRTRDFWHRTMTYYSFHFRPVTGHTLRSRMICKSKFLQKPREYLTNLVKFQYWMVTICAQILCETWLVQFCSLPPLWKTFSLFFVGLTVRQLYAGDILYNHAPFLKVGQKVSIISYRQTFDLAKRDMPHAFGWSHNAISR